MKLRTQTIPIILNIREERELFSRFDDKILSQDVISFLKERIKGTKGNVSLCICSDSPVNEKRVRDAFALSFTEVKKTMDIDRKFNTLNMIRLLVIGIFFILLWYFVRSRTAGVGPEILSIIGSFAIWEATNILIVDNPEIRMNKLLLKILENAEITFTSSRGDDPAC
ncbi:MAG: hypothetical protein J6S83_06375 [Lachnospiraceae bacterium]|nr:hypothetical protein [Lachnospiraceae bacterium]